MDTPDASSTTSLTSVFIGAQHVDINERVECQSHSILSPIFRMPIELLSRVFVEARNMDSDTGRFLPAVSQTCRSWRAVALDCATLWDNIDCTRPSWAKSMLSRTRGCPLTLVIEVPPRCVTRHKVHMSTRNDEILQDGLDRRIRRACISLCFGFASSGKTL